jgi:hypothetical protein
MYADSADHGLAANLADHGLAADSRGSRGSQSRRGASASRSAALRASAGADRDYAGMRMKSAASTQSRKTMIRVIRKIRGKI